MFSTNQLGPTRDHRDRRASRRLARALRSPIVLFGLSGLLAAIVIGAIGVLFTRHQAEAESLRAARNLTRVLAATLRPNLTDALLSRDPSASADLDTQVRRRALVAPVIRIKVWSPSGNDRLLRRASARRIGVSTEARRPRGARLGGDRRRGQRRVASREPLRARTRADPRGLYAGRDLDWPPPSVRDLPALRRRERQRRAAVRRVHAGAARGPRTAVARSSCPLAWSLARRLAPAPGEAGATAASRARRLRCGAATNRLRPARHRRAGAARHLLRPRGGRGAESRPRRRRTRRRVQARGRLSCARTCGTSGRCSWRSIRSAHGRPDWRRARADRGAVRAMADLEDGACRPIAGCSSIPTREELVYRTAQEALRNVRAHAQAAHVRVSLSATTATPC